MKTLKLFFTALLAIACVACTDKNEPKNEQNTEEDETPEVEVISDVIEVDGYYLDDQGLYYNIVGASSVCVWKDIKNENYKYLASEVVIPQKIQYNGKVFNVTSITPSAFANNSTMTKCTIGTNITELPEKCFYECNGLVSVSLPSNITVIPKYCFQDCDKLENFTFPKNVTSIEDGAFSYCESLVTITIPASVESLADGLFSHTTILKSIHFASLDVPDVSNYAFTYIDYVNWDTYPSVSIYVPQGTSSSYKSVFDKCYWFFNNPKTYCDKIFEYVEE